MVLIFCVNSMLGLDVSGAEPKGKKSSSRTVSLLNGKLTLGVPSGFVQAKTPKQKKALAEFDWEGGDAWGAVLRGTLGLTPEALPGYLNKRVAEYSKGLPAEFNVKWLKKEIVTIDGRKWADFRFVAMPGGGGGDYRKNPLYTRFLTTSYEGQMLEVTFSSNTMTEPVVKAQIDQIMDSMKLAD